MNKPPLPSSGLDRQLQPRILPSGDVSRSALNAPKQPPVEVVDTPYLVTTCTRGVLTQSCMSAEQVLALEMPDVDFHYDKAFGKVAIRTPHGDMRQYVGEIPGLGPDVGLPFLEDILWSQGHLTTERELAGSLPYHWKTANSRDRQVARLRKAFGDDATTQHYFIVRSRPWRIAWNLSRSWRMVERR